MLLRGTTLNTESVFLTTCIMKNHPPTHTPPPSLQTRSLLFLQQLAETEEGFKEDM